MNTATTLPFRNPDLPLDDRVRDLVSRLTLEEKVSQMLHDAKAIPRLSLPAYNYWNEALHGVTRNGRANVFPQAIGMAATWDAALVRRICFHIVAEQTAVLNDKGQPFHKAGVFRVTVGGCSPGARGEALGAPIPAALKFTMRQ